MDAESLWFLISQRSGTDDSTVTFEQFCFAFGIDSSQFVLPSKGGALEEVRPPAAAAPEEIGDALGGGGPVPMATDMPAWDRGITGKPARR